MVLYSDDIYYVLGLASIPAWISIYYFFVKKNINTSIAFLVLSAFTNRVVFALLDPFLHNWDEKFHALVSKNLMSYPIKPMLRVDAILPYDIAAWCCNHIWVHKQPLFLWQMALSMKMLGVHEITLRLPSIVMGTFSVFLIFDLARRWTQKSDVAFLAAFLFSFSYFQLELTSGLFSSEHNDIAFAFYLTASIWAFVRYTKSEDIKWVLLIGFFSGAAILNKWLTGLLVYGGWGLYEVALYKKDIILSKIKHIFLSFITCVATFLPWQLYILYRFPLESAITHKHNALHITEALEGHSGDAWFHLHQMPTMYGKVLLFFIPIGLYYLFWNKNVSRSLSVSLVFMVVTLYTFFSVIVQTKMPAFTFPMYAIVWILISTGIIHVLYFIQHRSYFMGAICVLLAVYSLKPWQVAACRGVDNIERNHKIANTLIYKGLDVSKLEGRVVLNCKGFEDVELMFYQNVNAYHWYPDQHVLDSLLQRGYTFAAFKSHNNQQLPDYILQNPNILIINENLQ